MACLSSICLFYGGNVSVESLRRLSGTSIEGTTLLGLQQAAQAIGFDVEGLEADSIDSLSELTEPVILHITLKNKFEHYVVYYPQNAHASKDNGIVINDPAHGIKLVGKDYLEQVWKTKTLLRLSPTSKFVKKENSIKEKRKWLFSLLRDDLNVLLTSVLLGIIISGLGISTAIFSQKLMDEILPRREVQRLFSGLVLISLMLMSRSSFAFLRGYILLLQGRDFNNRVINDFYKNLLYLPKSFFDTRKIGELIARMNDTRRIQTVVSVLVGSISIDILVVFASIAFVFTYSTEIGYLVSLFLPIYFFILKLFGDPITLAQREVMAGYAVTQSHFVDSIQGIVDIKLTSKQEAFAKINSDTYFGFQNSIAKIGLINLKFIWFIEFTGVVLLVGVFIMSSWLVLLGKLSLGQLVSLIGIMGSIMPALNRIIAANFQLSEAKVALERMYEFTSMDKEEKNPNGLEVPSINFLKIRNVSFRFPGRKQILKDISISLRKGEMVALKGESGGGKSTLMQLLQKFYSPEIGVIEVNGQNLEELSTQQWRKSVGCVPQEVKIFNGNLLYNITLSDDPKDFEAAIAFCRNHGFEAVFQSFPQGYLTLLGEEGINISGGQRQLVAIARALFKKPHVLLLDEATSAMDKKTEVFVLGLLQNLKPDMVILFVTHRNDTAEFCDTVYQLENGNISLVL